MRFKPGLESWMILRTGKGKGGHSVKHMTTDTAVRTNPLEKGARKKPA